VSPLERTYRRALRWFPRQWRSANEDAMVGTLLDVAEADRRPAPARGELANLRLSAMAIRLRIFILPATVRNRASALALGLGTAISVSAIAQSLIAQWAVSNSGARESTWAASPLAVAGIAVYAAWIAAFVASLVGLNKTSRALAFATIPLSVAARIVEQNVAQVVWASTMMLAVLGLLAVIAGAGSPGAIRRGRLATAAALLGSMVATASVDLWHYGNPFAQGPIMSLEYLLGGGPGFSLLGQDRVVLFERDILLRPFDSWFAVAIPIAIIAAGILNRFAHRSWAAAVLVLVVPMGLTLLFASPGAPDYRSVLIGFFAVALVIAALLGLLRLFGVRIQVTRT
jgi:hypothetical protein